MIFSNPCATRSPARTFPDTHTCRTNGLLSYIVLLYLSLVHTSLLAYI